MIIVVVDPSNWQKKILGLLKQLEHGQDLKLGEGQRITWFVVIGEDLYKCGFSAALLKLLVNAEA